MSKIKKKIQRFLKKKALFRGINGQRDLILPIKNSPGRFVYFCPGCNDYHVINTDCKRQWPCHTLTGSLNNPTIRASVLSIGDSKIGKPHCHSYITNGNIKFLNDSTHQLSGKTIAMKPL